MLEEIQYSTLGFEVTESMVTSLQKTLGQVLSSAPSCSMIRMTLEKSHRKFQGVLRISSLAGVFESSDIDCSFDSLLSSLKSKIDLQLKKWQETRFCEKIIRLDNQNHWDGF